MFVAFQGCHDHTCSLAHTHTHASTGATREKRKLREKEIVCPRSIEKRYFSDFFTSSINYIKAKQLSLSHANTTPY